MLKIDVDFVSLTKSINFIYQLHKNKALDIIEISF